MEKVINPEEVRALFDNKIYNVGLYRDELTGTIGNCPVRVLLRQKCVYIRPHYIFLVKEVAGAIAERKNQIQGFDIDLDGTSIILYKK